MALTYHAGRRIQGLSTDTFPTFEDDFTSYATQGAADAVWVEDGTGKVAVNITDNDIDFNLKTETTAHGINYDFGVGNVSDTEWIIRYKMNLTTVNTTTMYTYWGLSSVSGSGTSTTRDFIGFNTTGTTFYGHDRDGADDTGGGDNSQSYTLLTGTDYYVTIKRTSATAYAYTLQTGSFSGTTVVNGTGTCASTIVGLRYFNCRNLNNQTTAGNLIGTIDDFEFYNGVTTPPTKPTNVQVGSRYEETDTRKMYYYNDPLTFENDFSSDNMLDQNSSRIGISSGVLNFDARRGSFNHASSWDIGSTLNDTKWSMRFKMVISTLTQQNDTCRCYIGMSSLPSSSDSNATHDFIGFHAKISSGNNDWKAIDTNGASMDIEGTDFGDIATGTYYVEIIRKSATTYSIRITTNSDYTGTSGGGLFDGALGSGTNCSGSADTVNLRYFWIGNVNAGGTENARFIGTIDDMKIYNGVTSTDPVWSELG